VDHIRRVVIGLGSNLGDRAGNIDKAVALLREDHDMHVMKVSPLYETAPEGGADQPAYLNGAVLVLTSLDAPEVMARALKIEADLGRVRTEKNAPRTIDLDLLWIEGESVEEGGLVVPHKRLTQRAFALKPLIDLAPDARDAGTGAAFADLALAQVELTRVRDGE
jgi:2-amino-4-hydroxy-6-hydroxymethyldihydropteridine diphosphokinase